MGEKAAQEEAARQKLLEVKPEIRDLTLKDLDESLTKYESMTIAKRPSLRAFQWSWKNAMEILAYAKEYGFDSKFRSQFDTILEYHRHLILDVSAFCVSWITHPVIMSLLSSKQLRQLREALEDYGKEKT